MSPFSFEIQVSHQIQRHLLQSLPAARGLQHCASWRSDDHEEGPAPSTTSPTMGASPTATRSPAGPINPPRRTQPTPFSEEPVRAGSGLGRARSSHFFYACARRATGESGHEAGRLPDVSTNTAPDRIVELRRRLGQQLADRRNAAGMTQRALVVRTFVDRSYMEGACQAASSAADLI